MTLRSGAIEDLLALERKRQSRAARRHTERIAKAKPRIELPGVSFDLAQPQPLCPTCRERPSIGRIHFARTKHTQQLDCQECNTLRRTSTVPVAPRVSRTQLPKTVMRGAVWKAACRHWPNADFEDDHLNAGVWGELRHLTEAEFERGVRRAMALHEFRPSTSVIKQLGKA